MRGCGRDGRPAFPAPSYGANALWINPGALRSGTAESRFDVIARSGSDEAIHRPCCPMDCLAEPVIGRRYAPSRWLAMTLFDMLRSFTSCRSHPPVVNPVLQCQQPVRAHCLDREIARQSRGTAEVIDPAVASCCALNPRHAGAALTRPLGGRGGPRAGRPVRRARRRRSARSAAAARRWGGRAPRRRPGARSARSSGGRAR